MRELFAHLLCAGGVASDAAFDAVVDGTLTSVTSVASRLNSSAASRCSGVSAAGGKASMEPYWPSMRAAAAGPMRGMPG